MKNFIRFSIAFGTLVTFSNSIGLAAEPATPVKTETAPQSDAAAPAFPPNSPAATEEIKKLVGSWRVVEGVRRGLSYPRPVKIIVTPTKITFPDYRAEFRIDPAQSPKTLDCRPENYGFAAPIWPAIYELDGDKLRICFGVRATVGATAVRPDAFKAELDMPRVLVVLERCRNVSTLPEKLATAVDAALARSLDAGIALLERKENQAFFEQVLAGRYKRYKAADAKPGGLEETLQIFRAARRLTPVLNHDRTQATIDLTPYHIDGVELWNHSELKFIRDGERWVWNLPGAHACAIDVDER